MVKPRRTLAGFTMIEMLVTLAVVGILAGIAAPSFTSVVASQKVKTSASMLQSSLLAARSEALKHNANVTVAPIGGIWTAGWTIAVVSTGEILANNNKSTSATIAGPASITYNNAGRVSGSSGVFKFSSPSTSNIVCLRIELSGLPMTASSGC